MGQVINIIINYVAPLPVHGELLVLQVELDEGLPGVQPIPALQCSGVDTWIGG